MPVQKTVSSPEGQSLGLAPGRKNFVTSATNLSVGSSPSVLTSLVVREH
jgi:hypothetical protein